jgi:hypothetical protein
MVPECDDVLNCISYTTWMNELWDKFYTAAPTTTASNAIKQSHMYLNEHIRWKTNISLHASTLVELCELFRTCRVPSFEIAFFSWFA